VLSVLTCPDTEPRIRGRLRRQVAVALAERFRAERLTVLELAREAHRRPSTVRRLLAEAGVRGDDDTCVGYTDEEIARVVTRRFRGGEPVVTLHRDTGIDERVLRQVLLDAGEELEPRQAAPVDQLAALRARYENGASIQELADELDSSYGSVRRVLVRAGVTFRPRGGRP
jgi:hypothetical protein